MELRAPAGRSVMVLGYYECPEQWDGMGLHDQLPSLGQGAAGRNGPDFIELRTRPFSRLVGLHPIEGYGQGTSVLRVKFLPTSSPLIQR